MPSDTPKTDKFYLTTPIYYVNARPHIGHAYTTIVADVLARRHRLQGHDTFFLTGTDEHGQKIERSAAAAGIPPQQFADEVSAQFRALWDRMGLTYNRYIRTTDPAHKQGAQQLFRDLYNNGHIYLSTYTGSYCVSDEAFVDLPPGTPCPDCGRALEIVTEENFFFKLSEFQLPLLNLIESNQLRITPDTARNEVLSFVRGGLKDLSISRSSFTWGIPVPPDVQQAAGTNQNHVIYVWLDALANYITAIGYGSDNLDQEAEFKKYWPADLHLVGKEITRFHCVYWPAFLLAAGLPTPKQITANGWLLFDNAKMSKSRGNVVRTETILDAFGDHVYGKQFPDSTKHERDLFAADVLRYFLLREIPFGQDGSFSFDALITRYNADLANGYGNLVSRTLKMVQDNLRGTIPTLDNSLEYAETPEEAERFASESAFGRSNPFRHWGNDLTALQVVEEFDVYTIVMRSVRISTAPALETAFQACLGELAGAISITDRFISGKAPWKLAKSSGIEDRQKLSDVLVCAATSIRIITALLYPILPHATAKVWQQLGLGDIEHAAKNGELNNLQWGGLPPGTKLGLLSPIFPRADKGLAQHMIDTEESRSTPTTTPTRPETPLKASTTPTPAAPITSNPTDPAAPPRTTALDEPSGTLPVAGSTATTTAQPATPAPTPEPDTPITIDDFLKIDLRVAQILVAERIPKADKLLRLEVDLGSLGTRQILSGIAGHYTPEELIGRRIVVVANLAPRKMRGLDSHGMLLAASEGPDGKPILATFAGDIPLGSRVR